MSFFSTQTSYTAQVCLRPFAARIVVAVLSAGICSDQIEAVFSNGHRNTSVAARGSKSPGLFIVAAPLSGPCGTGAGGVGLNGPGGSVKPKGSGSR